jgi:hypothetical protein
VKSIKASQEKDAQRLVLVNGNHEVHRKDVKPLLIEITGRIDSLPERSLPAFAANIPDGCATPSRLFRNDLHSAISTMALFRALFDEPFCQDDEADLLRPFRNDIAHNRSPLAVGIDSRK